MRKLTIVALALWVALPAFAQSPACKDEAPCTVPTGTYLLHQPSGWDGKTRLPAVMFFHGYRGSAKRK